MINTLGHLDVDAALLLCVFYSVSNNVYENLAQVEWIADQVFLVYFSDFYLEGLVFLCCLRADDNREIMHQICQRKGSSLSVMRPLAMRDMSSTSLTRFIRCAEAVWIFWRQSSTRGFSSMCESAIEVMPMIAFIGVRISCDMLDRKVVFALFACCACISASCSACVCSFCFRTALRDLLHHDHHQDVLRLIVPGHEKRLADTNLLPAAVCAPVLRADLRLALLINARRDTLYSQLSCNLPASHA